jgi:hypothetical protein
MGLRHVKIASVEQTYESIHLNQYLDLYDTIGASIGRKKRFTLTEEHLHILAILDETITDLLHRIETQTDSFVIAPYRLRFKNAQKMIVKHLQQLHYKDALEFESVRRSDLVKQILS